MSGNRAVQGVLRAEQLNPDIFRRDVRSPFKKMLEWLAQPSNMVVTLFMITGGAYYYPSMAQFVVPGMIPFVFWSLRRKESAAIKMPVQSGKFDPNERNPANDKSMKAQGIFCIGNNLVDGKEIWLTNDDCRQHFLVLGTTGAGKSLPLDAPVHTPMGWRTMAELKVGTLVSTPDGRSAPVTGYFPQGELEICRITFDDGRTAEACPEHLWEIHHKHWGGGKQHPGISRAGMAKPRMLTTRKLAETLESNKGAFHIRLPEAVEKPAADLPLDPYLLGAMLGDGNFTSGTLRFSSADAELVTALGAVLPSGLELHHYDCNAPADWNVRFREGERRGGNPLRQALADLSLFGVGSSEKFIPSVYKEGSVAQRWALVQGLMDTDGSCDARKPSLTFSTSSERLARDFQEVVRSLGGIAKSGGTRLTSYVHNGERRFGKPSWRIHVRHPELGRFFSLPRKVVLADRPYQHASHLRLRVTKVEMGVRRAQAACIMVDHPDHLFITRDYVVTHNTELLIGFAANAVSWGSGLLYCDGKGDVSLFAKMYALCRKWGREDDLLVLNFMNGNKDDNTGKGVRSNTLNPFSTGASDGLTQMIVGLMPEVGGDGAMWKGRAVAMLTGVIKALVWLREKGGLDLNVGTIREFMGLKNIISLASDRDYPELPRDIRASVRAYLTSLPGYVESKGIQQAQTTLDQHGYLEMQFSQIFGSLNDVYGHIFKSAYGQIDMADVVLNRRILVIMLPALEKSQDELSNLGKIVVANLKGMMGGTLGSNLEGSWEDVVERRPTSAPSPFMCILDEVGYYTVDGMALMAAQARSLGFSMVYASQDIPAMQRNNEKEAASIIANTNTKIFMRTEEADKTGDLAVKSGGEVHRAQLADMERYEGEVQSTFRSGKNVRFEKSNRVTFLDLKSQGPGELTITYKGELVRGKAFYADPSSSLDKSKHKLKLRANHFIEVARPSQSVLTKEAESLECMRLMTEAGQEEAMAAAVKEAMENLDAQAAANDEPAMVAQAFLKAVGSTPDMVTAACCAVARLSAQTGAAVQKGSKSLAVRGNRPRREMDEPYEPDGMPQDIETLDGGPSYMDDEHLSPRLKARNDPNVGHAVSVDNKKVWDPGKGVSNSRELLKCLAELDFDDTAPPNAQQLDNLMNEHLGSAPVPAQDVPRIAAKAQEFEDAALDIGAILPPEPERLAPAKKPKPAVAAAKPADKAQATGQVPPQVPVTAKEDKEEEGEGGGGDQLIEDFISGLLSGENR